MIGAAVGRHPLLAAGGLLAGTWLVTLVVPPFSNESVGDLGTRSAFAAQMLGGALPYRDFAFEYPPLAAPAIALAGIGGTGAEAYRLGIAAVTLILALAMLPLVRALAARTEGVQLPALLAVALAPLLLGAVVRLHIDPLPVVLVLGALAALITGRSALALALVGLGALAKGFPLVVAPVALAWLWGRGDRESALRAAAALAATLAAGAGAWLVLSPAGALDSIAYQLERPVQVESSPASVLFAAGWLGAGEPSVVDSHGSAGLSHPLDTLVGGLLAIALAGVVAVLSLLAGRVARGAPPPAGHGPPAISPAAARGVVLAALAALVAFAALGRVLSPQFLVWCIPLLALAVAWRMPLLAAATATACVLTQVEFPWLYLDLVAADPAAATITAARNAALLATLTLAAAKLAELAGVRLPGLRRGRGVRRSPAS